MSGLTYMPSSPKWKSWRRDTAFVFKYSGRGGVEWRCLVCRGKAPRRDTRLWSPDARPSGRGATVREVAPDMVRHGETAWHARSLAMARERAERAPTVSPLEARGYGVAYSAAGRLSDRLDVELGMLAPESRAAMLERICSAGELRRAMVANQPTG